MYTINLSNKDINKLKPLRIYEFDLNESSYIYEYYDYVLKIFCTKSNFILQKNYKIINLLDRYRDIITSYFNEFILPVHYVYINDKFAGFTMEKFDRTLTRYFDQRRVFLDDKLEYLAKVGDLIEKMSLVRKQVNELKDFYINDIHSGNIFIAQEGIKIGDIDSVKLGNCYNFESYYSYNSNVIRIFKQLKDKYEVCRGKVKCNEQSELFCYIMMIMDLFFKKYLASYNYYDYMKFLEKLDKKGFDTDLLECFASVYEKKDNINPNKALRKVKISDLIIY